MIRMVFGSAFVSGPISSIRMATGEYEHIDDENENQDISSLSPSPLSLSLSLTPLLHGQMISLFISGTGFFASLLSSSNSNCPILLSLLNYFLLSFYLLRLFWKNEKTFFDYKFSRPYWNYLLIGLIDVEANILVNSAYNYTSITSIMLLDCFSIPCVMILSFIFLKAQYSRLHLYGVFVCLI